MAQQRGYKCVFVCPDKVGEDKRTRCAYGAEVVVCPTAVAPEHPDSYYNVSDRLTREIPGAWKPNQYSNPAGPASHYETTGPEIWRDTDGKITHFVAGVGTGGTITGTGRYLGDVSGGAVKVVGVDPEGSVYPAGRPPVPRRGRRRGLLARGLRPDGARRDHCRIRRRLLRDDTTPGPRGGLLVGGSCGMAVVAALEVAKREGPDSLVVVLLPDGGRGYLGKIFNDEWMSSYGFLRSSLDGADAAEPTVGDVLRGKSGGLPDLVHTHPQETLRDAIEILREYGVSQMPVVGAEPPIMAGEIAGAVTERDLLSAVFLAGRPGRPGVEVHGRGLPADRRR